MRISRLIIFFAILFSAIIGFIVFLFNDPSIAILHPKGIIAGQERDLIIAAIFLMLLIVIPTYIGIISTAWKYREDNPDPRIERGSQKAKYSELFWWLLPTAIVILLATITWQSTHLIDPYRPIDSDKKPLNIQVVALQWKWLFIYPEQNIATVNYIEFPEKTPLHFTLTADAPMNSFWIPELGSQMYAMEGMQTQLHLMANETGDFPGRAAEISGKGFAGMTFTAKSRTEKDFEQWIETVKLSPNALTQDEYNKLSSPSENTPEMSYNGTEKNLYGSIMMKFMPPTMPSQMDASMENMSDKMTQ